MVSVIMVLLTWAIVFMLKLYKKGVFMYKSKLLRALAIGTIVFLAIYFDFPLDLGGVL